MSEKIQSRPVKTHRYVVSLEPCSAFTCFSISHLTAIWVYCILQFPEASFKPDQIKFFCSFAIISKHGTHWHGTSKVQAANRAKIYFRISQKATNPQDMLQCSNHRTRLISLIQESVSPKIRNDCLKKKQAKHLQSGSYYYLAIESVKS